MRSERIVYSTCSSNARNSFSGGIDGRPVCEYMPANSGDICSSTLLTIFSSRRSGWSFGTLCSGEI